MATNLENVSISASFGSVLHLANDNIGATTAELNVYTGSGSALPLKLSTDAVHVDSPLSANSIICDGNVGVGTSVPNKTLTVMGSICAKDEINVRATDGLYWYTPAHTYGYRMRANANDSNDYGILIEKVDGTDLMNIRPDGKIALNHALPLNQLHIAVSGTDGHDGILITREDSTTADGDLLGGIAFDSTDGNEPSSILQGSAFIAAYAAEDHSTGDKGGDLVFGASKIDDNDDTTSHEYMRITSEGKVGVGTNDPTEALEVVGNVLLDADNATLRLESGATGTKGFIEWGFTSSTIPYASAGIDYDTRASKGFQIGSRNYPMTIQANGGFDFLEDEITILTVDSNNVTLKNAGAANEGGELRFEPGTNYSEQYNLDSAANLFRVHSSGTVRCGVSGNSFFIGKQAESVTFGDVSSLFLSAGTSDGHGPNIVAESEIESGFGITVAATNTTDNDASNGHVLNGAYLQAFGLSGYGIAYFRSDSTLSASRGNNVEQGRWLIGQYSNSGPNYDADGGEAESLGRVFNIQHQYSTNGGSTYSNGYAVRFSDSGAWIPGQDNTQDLGLSDIRWDDVYATNGTIQTSDRNNKDNIADSALGLDFIKTLRPVSYKWKDYTSSVIVDRGYGDLLTVQEPLSSETHTINKTFNRTHYGLIAQEVATSLTTAGVPASAFAGYIDPSVKNGEDQGGLGLRYEEFISPMIKAIQEQQTIIESLSTRLAALE